MTFVTVNQLKPGSRLIQDVMTSRNNKLFAKGTAITPREIEILSAFLIDKVHIESGMPDTDQDAGLVAEVNSGLALYTEYAKLIALLKRAFELARSSGESLSILDIRKQVESLLANIDQYQVLQFRPPQYSPKDYILYKSVRVSMTSYLLAKWHGFEQRDLIPIALAGLLHDIGNARIDAALLAKKGTLTAAEQEEMRTHTRIGYSILKNVAGLNEGTKLVAVQHHEREDGSGYPLGLRGNNIHPYTKIVAIADIYHAMSSDRSYRQAVSPYVVLEQLLQYSFGTLDPAMVRTFVSGVTQFQTGAIVRLSDDRIGSIVFTTRDNPTRPLINTNGTIVNLAIDRSVYIQDVIQQ